MNWLHSSVRWLAAYMPWADALLVKADSLLGYDKQADAERFWDEWRPRPGLRVTQR